MTHAVTGDVVHVSAWRDEDKRGRRYRDYFPNAASYTITNYGGERGEAEGSLRLDLSQPLDGDLEQAYDFVLNHTTLEHVYDVKMAISNLFALSRSDVLIVAPFMQVEHWEAPHFGDYWRVCAHGLKRAAFEHGFTVMSLTSNHSPVWPIYYCLHARRSDGEAADLWDGVADGFGARPVAEGHPGMR